MGITPDYRRLIDVLAAALPPVEIIGLQLPALVEDGKYRDELGFIFDDTERLRVALARGDPWGSAAGGLSVPLRSLGRSERTSNPFF